MNTRFNFLLQVGSLIICTFVLSAAVAVLGNETSNVYGWILAFSCATLSFIGLLFTTFMIFRAVHRTGNPGRNHNSHRNSTNGQPRSTAHGERRLNHWPSLGQSPYGRYRMYNRKRNVEPTAGRNYGATPPPQSRLGAWRTHRGSDGRNFEDIGRRK